MRYEYSLRYVNNEFKYYTTLIQDDKSHENEEKKQSDISVSYEEEKYEFNGLFFVKVINKKEFYNFTISFNYELIDEEKLKVQEELKSYAINYFTNNIKEVNAKKNKYIKECDLKIRNCKNIIEKLNEF